MSEEKDPKAPEQDDAAKPTEDQAEHPEQKHPEGEHHHKHPHHKHHDHAVIHPPSTGVTHLDPGVVSFS